MTKRETVQLFSNIADQLKEMHELLEQSEMDRKELLELQKEMLSGLKMLMKNQSTMWERIKQWDG